MRLQICRRKDTRPDQGQVQGSSCSHPKPTELLSFVHPRELIQVLCASRHMLLYNRKLPFSWGVSKMGSFIL